MTKREHKARIKLIQEMHLKKEAQKWIDKAVSGTAFRYIDLYRYWRGWVDRGMPYTWTAKGTQTFDKETGETRVDIRPGTTVITPRFDAGGIDRYHTGIGLHSDFVTPSVGGNWCSGSRAGLFEMGMTL